MVVPTFCSFVQFACVVAVFLWLWSMGMFALEILINRFQSFAINETVFKTLIRGGDGLFFLLVIFGGFPEN